MRKLTNPLEDINMDAMSKLFGMAGDFLGHIMHLGVKLIAVGVVLQILFGAAVPFLGLDVVGAITSFVGALGEKGLVGLVALAVIYWSFKK
jgi:hypothetical protein